MSLKNIFLGIGASLKEHTNNLTANLEAKGAELADKRKDEKIIRDLTTTMKMKHEAELKKAVAQEFQNIKKSYKSLEETVTSTISGETK